MSLQDKKAKKHKKSIQVYKNKETGLIHIKIHKSVPPADYLDFVKALKTEEGLSKACDIMVANGHTNAYLDVLNLLFEEQAVLIKAIREIDGKKPDVETSEPSELDKEVITALKGIQ